MAIVARQIHAAVCGQHSLAVISPNLHALLVHLQAQTLSEDADKAFMVPENCASVHVPKHKLYCDSPDKSANFRNELPGG